MDLWLAWWNIVSLLRPAFSRSRTFFWFLLVLMAFAVRKDLAGVTSFVRALGLSKHCYERLLHFFHSDAVKIDQLAELWLSIVISLFPRLPRQWQASLASRRHQECQRGAQDARREVPPSAIRV